ncbi:hypothetical protein ES288_A12G179900v1 [Gossypium darwinii]|uniref:Uncharacterized protein n=1 Tax=Gossypium darwinii TaxID=34276 RepID=A0A5D2EAB4_GOSDA|nr:hypothetical protein ES288_A12G179900v1 [Gossypium darwinii]
MLLESLQWSLVDCILLKPFLLLAKFVQSNHSAYVQDMSAHNFLEVGAAALLKYFGTADMPYLDQLLQTSLVTTIANSIYSLPFESNYNIETQ